MLAICANGAAPERATRIDIEQVPGWSTQDMDFFLHGSMSAEVVPENGLRAFIKTYPDLFPTSGLSHLGLIPDSAFGWPIGLSRKRVKHLGGLSAVGINCASCHVAEITSTSASEPIRILGATSHFDVEAFFGSILAATFRTSNPANMKKFLDAYLNAEPEAFDAAWEKQQKKILATMKADPFGAKDVGPGELHKIASAGIEPSFLFAANCNSCHGGPESDERLYTVAEIGTDPHRAQMFTQKLADGFNKFLAELEAEGYQPPKESGVRSTGKYFAATLNGVWARSPYLHNGSVRTMEELLTQPDQRAKSFRRGSHAFDEKKMGYADDGAYLFNTTTAGNSNSGHGYGTKLSTAEKRDQIEYLRTL